MLEQYRKDQGYSIYDAKDTEDDFKIKQACAQFNVEYKTHDNGNINDTAMRKTGRYFCMASEIGTKQFLGLNSDQESAMRSLTTSDGRAVDGYLFVCIDRGSTWAQWAIYPAIWDDTQHFWKKSKDPCGYSVWGEMFTDYADTRIDTSSINSNKIDSFEYTSDVSVGFNFRIIRRL